MKRILALTMAAAVAAGSLAISAGASSAEPYSRYDYWQKEHGRDRDGSFIAPFVVGSILGYGLSSAYDTGPYYAPRPYYTASGDAHVAWCMERYRTYDPRTNAYFVRPGVRVVCDSPYG